MAPSLGAPLLSASCEQVHVLATMMLVAASTCLLHVTRFLHVLPLCPKVPWWRQRRVWHVPGALPLVPCVKTLDTCSALPAFRRSRACFAVTLSLVMQQCREVCVVWVSVVVTKCTATNLTTEKNGAPKKSTSLKMDVFFRLSMVVQLLFRKT